ncbi:GIY-YIG nuclease family protein [Paenibacillus elgii]|uniref:LuxR family transcriptional regulator n=1 Tax=Paenibacillus elgii TaxID=189691 RepID=A0A2T6G7E4_9BACL|nr:GIY-YIG nuclease family protein [Paenibacillus elgii]MCM3268666.1 GIY-YIG nuclease family protein [Paenibacillus elgii]NEN83950.1 GIY-YIG nuclease family protein [Paenibacillus elgii]PUA40078.1 LuxR family transcriptional regulator [Paenibacillus elgii]
MDKSKRKELLEEFKQIKTYMGIIQITNKVSGKIFVDSYPNLKNKWMTIKMQLDMGRFANLELQKDWKELGAEAFTYEVLEEQKTDDVTDMKWELKMMEKPWLEKLQPYGDRGYNKPPRQ